MKTVDEFIKEIETSDTLKNELKAAKDEAEGEIDDDDVEAVAGGRLVPTKTWCPYCGKEHELSIITKATMKKKKNLDTYYCGSSGLFYRDEAGKYFDDDEQLFS